MLPYRDSRLTSIIIAAFFLIVLAYAYFEARGLLFGPSIQIADDVQEVHQEFITIRGTADRIASLTINGTSVNVTENGSFEEPYLLAPGLNRIVLEAADKYGHTRRQILQIVYSPERPSTDAASSTAISTSTTDATSTPPVAP